MIKYPQHVCNTTIYKFWHLRESSQIAKNVTSSRFASLFFCYDKLNKSLLLTVMTYLFMKVLRISEVIWSRKTSSTEVSWKGSLWNLIEIFCFRIICGFNTSHILYHIYCHMKCIKKNTYQTWFNYTLLGSLKQFACQNWVATLSWLRFGRVGYDRTSSEILYVSLCCEVCTKWPDL